jgi:hypothetical protein
MMARTVEVPVKLTLDNAWVVRPGDKLVLGYSRSVISEHDAAMLRERIAERLPGVDLVIITDVTHMAVYKPADDTLPAMDDAEFERRLRLWIRRCPDEFVTFLRKQERVHGEPFMRRR